MRNPTASLVRVFSAYAKQGGMYSASPGPTVQWYTLCDLTSALLKVTEPLPAMNSWTILGVTVLASFAASFKAEAM